MPGDRDNPSFRATGLEPAPPSGQEPLGAPRRGAGRLLALVLILCLTPIGFAATAFGTRVLVLGVDARPGDPGRADVLLLLSPQPRRGGLVMLSIARDTRAQLPGHGRGKINAAFAHGGAPLTRRAVERLTGLAIPHVLVVDFRAVEAVVDALGCVPVHVDRPMHYVDPYQDLRIHLEPGPRCLRGEEALGYVRFRAEPLGDIARVRRQRAFLRALIRQALRPASWPRWPRVWRALAVHARGDLGPLDLARVAGACALAALLGTREETLPGRPATLGGVSYWLPDPQGVRAVVRDLFGGPAPGVP